jgi:hypothetical protein
MPKAKHSNLMLQAPMLTCPREPEVKELLRSWNQAGDRQCDYGCALATLEGLQLLTDKDGDDKRNSVHLNAGKCQTLDFPACRVKAVFGMQY